jgi:protein SCO1/2
VRARRSASFPLVAGTVLVVLALATAGVRLLAPKGTPAPDFTLTDGDGRPFTLSAQRGRTLALFFGYTHCPDVCPATLSALAVAKRRLHGTPFAAVFVTVDPQRDTPAVVKRYVRLFDPDFVGLTGTPAELEPVYRAYHVYHAQQPAGGSANGYLVAHSSTVTLIGPNGRIRGSALWNDGADVLTDAIAAASS